MYEYNCKLVRVIDGDSVIFDIDLGFHLTIRETVRFLNCDAPEIRTKDLKEKQMGFVVRSKVCNELINAKNITIKTSKQGSFKRWLAEVYCDEVNLNKQVDRWSYEERSNMDTVI